MILWALSREVRTLFDARQDCDRGSSPQQALSARRVWKNRMGAMQAALKRHNNRSAGNLLQQLLATDASIKGYGPGEPWQQLEKLVLAIATGRTVTVADSAG